MKPRRTTHRSISGKKLYALRDSLGRFKDIVTYQSMRRKTDKPWSQEEVEKLRNTGRNK